jgi:uncharacterized membrane protein YgaE (UPF0421/DUF939 family)
MFKIGSRVIKTALGSATAIFIAQSLGLNFYSSAGILTILCIQPTKKRSLETSIRRYSACVVILFFSYFFFSVFGFNPFGIALLLLFFIPTLVVLNIQEGVISSSVIMVHIYSLQKISLHIVLNELYVISIGIGVALIFNLYMPSLEHKVNLYKKEIENGFILILEAISVFLNSPEEKFDLKELNQIEKKIGIAKKISKLEIDNHFFRSSNDEDYEYVAMRERQLEILKRIIRSLKIVKKENEQSKILSDFFHDICFSLNPNSTGIISLHQLDELYEMFRSMPLPKNSDDFETRAAILNIIHEMENFLVVKKSYVEKYVNKSR